MGEDEKDCNWNFHTCERCTYRSKSVFLMCKHVRLHKTKPQSDVFFCETKAPELFECEFCDFFTDMKVKLHEHFRVFHEEEDVNSELIDILRFFRCTRCDFATHSVLVWTKHTDTCNMTSSNHHSLSPPTGVSTRSLREISGNVQARTENYYTKKSQGNQKESRGEIPEKGKSKRHCCFFCSKIVTAMSRHLQYVHRSEPQMVHIMTLSSSDKATELKKLRFRGDKAYNDKVKPDKRISLRKPTFEKISRYIECPHCGALLARRNLSRHEQKCFERPPNGHTRRFKNDTSAESLPGSSKEKSVLRNVKKQDSGSDSTVQKSPENVKKLRPYQKNPVLKSLAIVTPSEKGRKEKYARRKVQGNCKRHCCCYCFLLITVLPRHLKRKHKDEPEIKRIMTLPPPDRKKEFDKLRLYGDKMYNEKVAPEKRIFVRKPLRLETFRSIECPNCNGLIGKKTFSRHSNKCFGKQPKRPIVLALPSDDVSENRTQLKELFEKVRNDEVGCIAATDETIKLMGVYCWNKLNKGKFRMVYIRSQMRICARLLLVIKKLDPTIKEMKDCITPEKHSVLMEGIKNICLFDGIKFRNHTMPQTFKVLLNRICAVLRFEYSKNIPASEPQIEMLDKFMAINNSELRPIARAIRYREETGEGESPIAGDNIKEL